MRDEIIDSREKFGILDQAHLSHLEIPYGRTHVAQREIVFINFVLLAVRVTSPPAAKRNGIRMQFPIAILRNGNSHLLSFA